MATRRVSIVGAGISGLMAALHLAEKGVLVDLFSLAPSFRSDVCSSYEGLASATVNSQDDDSLEKHFIDTLEAGEFLANQELVSRMCDAAPKLVSWLARMGVAFNRTGEGALAVEAFDNSPHARVLRAGAQTGRQILAVLDGQKRAAVQDGLIRIFSGWEFISLVKDSRDCTAGMVAQNSVTQEMRYFPTPVVLAASGGLGSLLGPSCARTPGYGNALAFLYTAGARLANPEFIQVDPLAFSVGGAWISVWPILRDLGARVWVSQNGTQWNFVQDFYSEHASLLNPQVLCQAVYHVLEDRKLGVDGQPQVAVDVTHVSPTTFEKKFPGFLKHFLNLTGVDLTSQPLLTKPAVSYHLGGLWVDADHCTNVEGLFAAGECQFQYHGAAALSSNKILSSLFSGYQASQGVLKYLKKDPSFDDNAQLGEETMKVQHELTRTLLDSRGPENPHWVAAELEEVMAQSMGFVRQNHLLKNAEDKIRELKARATGISLADRGFYFNPEISFARGLQARLELAHALVRASLMRNESRGFHFKPEFPNKNDAEFLKNTRVRWTAAGPKVEYEDVALKHLRPRLSAVS